MSNLFGMLMKKVELREEVLEINFLGRYWKENGIWIARIESMDLEARAQTPYICLLKLIELFEPEMIHEGLNCSISVYDSGIFYFLLKKLNETPHSLKTLRPS